MIFTSNIETIKSLESKFDRIENNEFNWTTEYVDPDTNSKWLKIRLRSESQGGGYPVMLKKNEISTQFLIKILISSQDIEQISVASALLEYFESYEKIEFRERLLEQLEKHYSAENKNDEFEIKRLDAIIENSTIYDDSNRREIIGKNDFEITSDHIFFKKIAARVNKLREL